MEPWIWGAGPHPPAPPLLQGPARNFEEFESGVQPGAHLKTCQELGTSEAG